MDINDKPEKEVVKEYLKSDVEALKQSAKGASESVKDITKQIEKIAEGTISVNDFLKNMSINYQDITDQQRKYLESQGKSIGMLREAIILSIRETKELEEQKNKAKTAKEQREIEEKILIKKLELQRKIKGVDDEEVKSLEEQIRLLREKNQNIAEGEERMKKLKDVGIAFVDVFTGGKFSEVLQLKSLDVWMKKAQEALNTVADANSSIASTTGIAGNRAAEFGTNLAGYGATVREAAESYNSLYTSMSSFSSLDQKTREGLAEDVTKLKTLGIGAGEVGKNYDVMTKGLGVSVDRVGDLNNELMGHAVAAGIPPAKMVQDFAGAMDKLAVYGQKGVDVYVKMQKASKSLGVEMGILNSVVGDQFDTFENSAKAAGRLNALLGGNYLNSVEMMNATEEERILILKRSMDQSGKNFASLNKWEQKAIAGALGITNMADANKLLGKSTEDLMMDMSSQAEEQTKLEEAQKAAAKTADKLNAAMLQMFTFMNYLLTPFQKIVQWIADLNNGWKQAVAWVMLVIGIFSVFPVTFTLLGKAFEWIAEKIGAGLRKMGIEIKKAENESGPSVRQFGKDLLYLGGAVLLIGLGVLAATFGLSLLVKAFSDSKNAGMALGAVIAVIAGFAIMIKFLGTIAKGIGPDLILLGFAMLLIGGAIAIAALGLAVLVNQFKETENAGMAMGAVIAVMVGMLGMVIALAAVSTVAGPQILLLGIGLLLIGAAVFLAAAGLAILVTAFKGLFSTINAGDIISVSIAMGIFVVALAVLTAAAIGLTATGGLIVIGLLAGALLALGIAIKMMGDGLSSFVSSIQQLSTLNISNLKDLASAADDIADGFEKISEFANNKSNAKVVQWIKDYGEALDLAASRTGLLAQGVNALQAALKPEKLDPFVKSLELLSKSIIKLSSAFDKIPESKVVILTEFTKQISDENFQPETKVAGIDHIVQTINSVTTITEEKLKPTKQFIETIKQYYEVKSKSKESDDNKLLDAIKELSKTLSSGGTQGSQGSSIPKTIMLKIDGLEWEKSNYGKTPIACIVQGTSFDVK